MSVDEGGVARFQCQINGIPEANISWERNRVSLNTTDSRYNVTLTQFRMQGWLFPGLGSANGTKILTSDLPVQIHSSAKRSSPGDGCQTGGRWDFPLCRQQHSKHSIQPRGGAQRHR